MPKGLLLGSAFLVVLFTSCTTPPQEDAVTIPEDEQNEIIQGYYGVHEELWPYFARFEEEALQRGMIVDLRAAEITGEIEDLGEDGVAGMCRYSSHFPNHVTIDISFWESATDRIREFVVFHELGHCELLRDHREAAYPNGTCVSIMRSGLGECRDNYQPATRSIYLDELFDPNFRDEIN